MLARGMEDINNAFDKMKKMLETGSKKYSVMVFSKELKTVGIEVSHDQKIVKRIEGTGSYPICLLDQPMTEFTSSFSAKLTDQPGNKGCWLGVCVKSIV